MVLEDIPCSPTAKLMHSPGYDLHILILVGFMTKIDVDAFKKGMERTVVKLPRFSSVLIENKKKCRDSVSWRRTKVDINDHVFLVDQNTDPDTETADKFIEDFTSTLSKTPMDSKKPLWEAHILNIETSDANSTVIFKIHHSLGDGFSLASLLLAAAKRVDDPESLPVMSTKSSTVVAKDDVWMIKRLFLFACWIVMVVFYTLADCVLFLATILFLKDANTVIEGTREGGLSTKRFVHRVVSFEDVRLIKNSMNVAVNDVLLGVADAGLTRYLNTTYAKEDKDQNGVTENKKNNFLPKNLYLRSAVVFNLRPSATIEDLAKMMEKDEDLTGRWGNILGIVLLPFSISLQDDDPLTYIRKAKAVMDRKKLSLGPQCSSLVMTFMVYLFGINITASLTRRVFKHTTLTFSSVIGPKDEVSLFGHPITYIAPSVYGFPQALIIHYQSYAKKLVISVGADEKLIPNPHQLCDDLVKSFEQVKETAIKERASE